MWTRVWMGNNLGVGTRKRKKPIRNIVSWSPFWSSFYFSGYVTSVLNKAAKEKEYIYQFIIIIVINLGNE